MFIQEKGAAIWNKSAKSFYQFSAWIFILDHFGDHLDVKDHIKSSFGVKHNLIEEPLFSNHSAFELISVLISLCFLSFQVCIKFVGPQFHQGTSTQENTRPHNKTPQSLYCN